MKFLISIFLFISGCASVTVTSNEKTHTLKLWTGTRGESMYVSKFNDKANETCKSGYQVLEKTRTPSTIAKELYNDQYFYWVISCN